MEQKYEQATMIKPRDHLESCPILGVKPFAPSYCKEKDQNMFDLLSMDYQRRWAEEQKAFKGYDKMYNKPDRSIVRQNMKIEPKKKVAAVEPVKRFKKYDHVKSKYMDEVNRPRREPCDRQ